LYVAGIAVGAAAGAASAYVSGGDYTDIITSAAGGGVTGAIPIPGVAGAVGGGLSDFADSALHGDTLAQSATNGVIGAALGAATDGSASYGTGGLNPELSDVGQGISNLVASTFAGGVGGVANTFATGLSDRITTPPTPYDPEKLLDTPPPCPTKH
jgi:hypothetical protein